MNLTILNTDVQKFITENLNADATKLILKGSPFEEVSVQELANQILAKKKSQYKLPTWFIAENIYYPAKVSIEQTSSEITAKYKAELISGENIVDITGGFGVDTFYFSQQFKKIIHCEINPELSKIVAHNFKQLEVKNSTTFSGDGIEFLKNTSQKFDCIYIDPSRRDTQKEKVFLLKDCLPNVPENLNFLFTKSTQILLKNSPILDIKNTINELKFVKEIHSIAVNNEVKELLFLLEKDYESDIKIYTINYLKKGIQQFNFTHNNQLKATYSEPLAYLYEPNVAVLKSGAFQEISAVLKVDKLHQHSHLYTSKDLIDFPGRSFQIEHILSYDKKKIKKLLTNNKGNVTTRNFPKNVAQIRKELNIKDGGTDYLFFTTDVHQKKIVLFCKKVN